MLKKYAVWWLISVVIIVTGVFWHYRGTHAALVTATEITPAQPLPNFELIRTDETAFTQENFRGHWSLLYFGYTHCPDICPAMMKLLQQTVRMLPAEAAQVVFVSADPTEDDLPQIDNYVHSFDPSFIGATGLPGDIASLTRALHLYFSNVEGDPNPIINHSNTLLLIDPSAHLVAIFNAPTSAQAIVADFKTITQRRPA